MKALLFGNMFLWKKGMDIVNLYHQEFELMGFSTVEENELTKSNPVVYSFEKLKELYVQKTIDAVILVDGSQHVLIRLLKENGILNLFAIPSKFLEMDMINEDFQKGSLRKVEDLAPELSQLEMHLADHCNLNCRGCSHFSNLVQKPVFANYNQFTKDLERLAELFDNIRAFFFLGGEPLLNHDVAKYLYFVREIFPYTLLHLVSNGLLVLSMQDELIQAMKETNCRLSISNYDCLDAERIQSFLEEKGITFDLRNGKEVFTRYLNPRGDGDKGVFEKCGRRFCTFLQNGRIASCGQPFNIKYFNEYFHVNFSEEGSISLYDKDIDGKKILMHLEKAMGACNFCTYDETFTWISGGTPEMSDWCVARDT